MCRSARIAAVICSLLLAKMAATSAGKVTGIRRYDTVIC
jgi:hypothetical protein